MTKKSTLVTRGTNLFRDNKRHLDKAVQRVMTLKSQGSAHFKVVWKQRGLGANCWPPRLIHQTSGDYSVTVMELKLRMCSLIESAVV